MRSKKDLATDIDSGSQAERLLSNPLLIASVSALQVAAIDRFSNLDPGQTKEMQFCNIRLSLAKEFESNLRAIVQGGEIALSTLQEINEFEKATSNG